MTLSKIFKIIGVIVAIAGIAAAVYFAVKKLTGKKEPEYFDDNDFFECDNDLEIIEVAGEEEAPAEEETPAEEAAEEAPTEEEAAE